MLHNSVEGGLMEIYIEYLIVDNLVVDSFILKLIELTNGFKIAKKNKFLVMFFGVIIALVMPYFYSYQVFLWIYRLVTSIILVLMIKKYKKLNDFISYYILFITYTFLIGGLCYGLINLLNIKHSATTLLLYNFEFPIGIFGIIFYIGLCFLKFVINLIKNKLKVTELKYEILLENNGKKIRAIGFFDTGNSLTIDNKGIIIISINTFLRLCDDMDLKNFEDLGMCKNSRYIEVKGIGGAEKCFSFEVDKVVINNVTYENFRVIVAKKNFKDFDCILHRDFVGGIL